ncbi:YadA-like family protein [uncultured Megasphaera sp.]|uniref:YadA-like family protein n=1 Tax=uncultured Megasphaera sp. TaxID=165188 RepID=UPI002592FEEF|nr:YadA-like family protein [uncultured Megasphaera sp.]
MTTTSVINDKGLTIGSGNTAVALTKDGLTMGGQEITNVKESTIATNAATVGQINKAKEDLKTEIDKKVDKTTYTDGMATKADANGANVTNPDTWAEKLGTGTISDTDGKLVTGKTVQAALKPVSDKADKNATNIATLQKGFTLTDGNTPTAGSKTVTAESVVTVTGDDYIKTKVDTSGLKLTMDETKLNSQINTQITSNSTVTGKMSAWKLKANGVDGEGTVNNTDNTVTFDAEKDKGLTVSRDGNTIKYGIDADKLASTVTNSINNTTNATAITNISAKFSISDKDDTKNQTITLSKNAIPNIQFLGDTNLTSKVDGTKVTYGLNAALTNMNSITFAAPTAPAGETSKALTINGTAGTITGLTNTTWNADAITSGRAATEDQLKALSDTVSGNASSSTDYQLVKAGTTKIKDGTEAYKADKDGNIDLLVQDKKHSGSIKKITISDVAKRSELVEVQKKLEEGFTVGAAGEAGTPGKDGTIGVKGADGSSVVINGKDGSIGMKGKDGANGKLFLQKVPGLDGADGETRMVYEADGKENVVATKDDGFFVEGDMGDKSIKQKLNTLLRVRGGNKEEKELTENNIGVVGSTDRGLDIKLAKNLKKLESAEFTKTVTTPNGNVTTVTTINDNGLTIGNNTDSTKNVSLTKDGLNMAEQEIKNVKESTTATNAATVGQVEKAKTELTTAINNKADYALVKADGQDGAYKVTNGKITLKVKNKTKPDEAAEDVVIDDVASKSSLDTLKEEMKKNIQVGGKGADGADGVDGTIGVNGKDGKPGIGINGKDGGSITIHGTNGADGKDGENGVTIRGIDGKKGEKGEKGVDGTTTINRIVTVDPNGTTHQLATLDDGLKFAGNVGNFYSKLNETVEIVGGVTVGENEKAEDKLTDENIGVVANKEAGKNGKLDIKLAKNLKKLESAEFTKTVTTPNGNVTTVTTINDNGLTIGNNTDSTKNVSLTKDGLNMAEQEIKNVKESTTATNAATVGQVNAAKQAAMDILTAGFDVKAGTVTGTVSLKANEKPTVEFLSDGNGLSVDLLTDAATHTQKITYHLSDTPVFGEKAVPGEAGKPGKDGKVEVIGKDGSAVVINGKDGSIGLNGKDGKDGIGINGKDGGSITIHGTDGKDGQNGLTIRGVDGKNGEKGEKGVDGTTTINRIVTVDPNGTTHQLATLDDGLKFAGNVGNFYSKLNETVEIVGGVTVGENEKAEDKLTDENIGVVANKEAGKNGKLDIKLAKNLKKLESAEFTKTVTTPEGDVTTVTTINDKGLTIGTGDKALAITENSIAFGKTGGTITGLTNKTWDGKTIVTGRAATEDQLKQVADTVNSNATAATDFRLVKAGTTPTTDGKGVYTPGTDGKIDLLVQDKNHKGSIDKITISDVAKQTELVEVQKKLEEGFTVGAAGEAGTPGKDGTIGVKGADGSSVVINGKDGSIGMKGKDGANGKLFLQKVPGLDGADGETRMVYEADGKENVVATKDDGFFVEGDMGDKSIKQKLNTLLRVRGGNKEEKELTENNIGVVGSTDRGLDIKLAKNLKKLESAEFTKTVTTPNGNVTTVTTINDNGLTIGNNTDSTKNVSLTKDGLNMAEQEIKNVKESTTATNAATVGQVEKAKTELTTAINNKADYALVKADGQDGAYKVTNGKITLKVKNKTKPDEAAEDVVIDDVASKSSLDTLKEEMKKNIQVGGKGADGADGVDGTIGVNGKDGKPGIGINGKDGGSITIHGTNGADGKDGENGLTIRGVDGKKGEKGEKGVDGTTTIKRIVITDPNGQNPHSVATLDDGLKFAGNVGNFYSKLNETVEIVGGEKNVEQLTDENIGVVAKKEEGKNGKLDIKLAKNLRKLESAEFTKTVQNGGKVETETTIINEKGILTKDKDDNISFTSPTETIISDAQSKHYINLNKSGITIHDEEAGTPGSKKEPTSLSSGSLTGLSNKTWDSKNITSGRAATEDQLQKVSEAVDANAKATTDFRLVASTDTKGYTPDTSGTVTLDVKDKNHEDKDAYQVTISDVARKSDVDKMLKEGFTVGEVGEAGKPGKDGTDGKVEVVGKDGSAVVINGKDGSIGMKGKDGANGKLFLQKVPGLDGADGETRMVYEADGKENVVATKDDGFFVEGDMGDKSIKQKLNTLLRVRGGNKEEKELTENNIGVVGSTDRGLDIKLAKNLKKLESAEFTKTVTTPNGNVTTVTTINDNGLTIGNNTDSTKNVSLTKDGLNMAEQEIKNVKESTTATNAATVGQVNAAKQAAMDILTAGFDVKAGTVTGNVSLKANEKPTVEFLSAGNGLSVDLTTDAATHTQKITYRLSDTPVFGEKAVPGEAGKPGKDGKVEVIGKDGSAVVINGKDGSIGLNGTNGQDGLSICGEKGTEGKPGVDGTTIKRIVITDPNGQNPHSVATLDDGLKFAGNVGNFYSKLNETVEIVGGVTVGENEKAEDKLTDENIGVVAKKEAGKNGKLDIKLAKDLKKLSSAEFIKNVTTPQGNVIKTTTVIDGDSIIIRNGSVNAVTITGNYIAFGQPGGTITGLTNTTWPQDTTKNFDVSQAATQGQLKILDDKLNKNEQDRTDFRLVASTDTKGYTPDKSGTVTLDVKDKNHEDKDAYKVTISDVARKSDVDKMLNEGFTVGEASKPGKDGTDGKVEVIGKDGSAVVINGKDGSIGLKGKDGKDGIGINGKDGGSITIHGTNGTDGQDGQNGLTIRGVDGKNGEKGEKGVDGKDINRIVTVDPNGTKHQLATLDDGLKFAGNVGNFYSKLNETVEIVGGEKNVEQLTDENIGVVAEKEKDKNGKLDIKLAKNLRKLESAEFTKTVQNGGKVETETTIINEKGILTKDKDDNISFTSPTETIISDAQSKHYITLNKSGITINDEGDGTPGSTKPATSLSSGSLTGLSNTTWDSKNITSGRAATEDQLKQVSDTVDANAKAATDFRLVKAGTTKDADGTKDYTVSENGKITLTVQDKNHKDQLQEIGITDVARKSDVDKMLKEGFTVGEVGEAGKPGKDGTDGKVEVVGKDGSAVVINGKDGSIGMKGKDGANGKLFLQKVPGLDGADGETRMVYEADGKENVVATKDDGFFVEGDMGDKSIKQKLNTLLRVRGGNKEEKELTENNIGVVGSMDRGLDIKLAKNLKNLESATFTKTVTTPNGDVTTVTTINDKGMTIGTGDKALAITENSIAFGKIGGTITGLTNTTWDGKTIVTGRAATEDQLKQVSDTVDANAKAATDFRLVKAGTTKDADGTKDYTVSENGKITLTVQDKNHKDQLQEIGITDVARKSDVDKMLKEGFTVGEAGKPGKDGTDGKVEVVGKDGSAVVINGKDGSIGLNGTNGQNGLSIRGEKGDEGKPGVDGTTTIKRIVITDPDGKNPHSVATLDDGLKFAGNVGNFYSKLNETVEIVGGVTVGKNEKAEDKLTDENIGVVATKEKDKNGKLNIKLAKDLKNLSSAEFIKNVTTPQGNVIKTTTVIDGDSIMIRNGSVNAVTITGNRIAFGQPGGTITGLTNTTWPKDTTKNFDAGQAATQGQLKILDDKVNQNEQNRTDFRLVKAGTTKDADGTKDYTVSENGKITLTVQDMHHKDQLQEIGITDVARKSDVDKMLSEGFTVGEAGKPGKDGTDGKVEVVGKDGSAVVIKGADGSIGLKGKDGKDGIGINGKDGGSITIHGTNGADGKDGENGVTIRGIDGKNGEKGEKGVDGKDINRIVTVDPNGTKHQVATLDDGLQFAGDSGDAMAKKLNETVTISGGVKDEKQLTDKNIGVVAKDGKLNIKLAKNLDGLESATFTKTVEKNGKKETTSTVINDLGTTVTDKDGNTNQTTAGGTVIQNKDGSEKIEIKKDGITIMDAGDGTPSNPGKTISLTKDGFDNGGNKITHIADGTADSDAATVGQVNAAKKEVMNTLTAGFDVKAGGVTGNISLQANAKPTVEFLSSGNGLSVDLLTDTATHTQKITYRLSDTPVFGEKAVPGEAGKPGKDGKVEVIGKDGSAVVINGKDGSIGLNGTNGQNGLSIRGEKGDEGKPGVDGTTIKRLVITDPDGKNPHAVATLDDGLKFAGDSGTAIAKKLNETVTISGGVTDETKLSDNNIGVVAKDGKLNVKLAKNLTGLESATFTKTVEKNGKKETTSTVINDLGTTVTDKDGNTNQMTAGGITITTKQKDGKENTVSLTKDGLNNGGKKIVQVADGDLSDKSQDAVTGKQLYATNQRLEKTDKALQNGIDFKVGKDTYTAKLSGDKAPELSFSGGDNITANLKDQTIQYSLNKDINVNSVTAGTTSMNGEGIKIKGQGQGTADISLTAQGLNNGGKKIRAVADGLIAPNSTEAVTGRQLYQTNAGIVRISDDVMRVGAGAAALAALHTQDFDPADKWDFAAGYGNYKSANALSLGAFYRPNERTTFSVGSAFGSGANFINAGVTIKLGDGKYIGTSKAALVKAVEDQQQEIDRQKQKLQSQSAEIQNLQQRDTARTAEMEALKAKDAQRDAELKALKAKDAQRDAQIQKMMQLLVQLQKSKK